MVNKPLTLGSLFSGSGGFEFGGILAGIKPLFSSEIEPFPILVTQKRLPDVKHYGDVAKLSGAELEPVDIITFGSPCQDLSIAGKRAGIHDGERSNLFFQAIRIIKEMREATNGKYPRYCVWENVPGAFSSNGGRDFQAVLEAVIGIKEEGATVPPPENYRWPKADVYLGTGWSVAYRVLDTQYFPGTPQRRQRIYLVGDFDGESAGEVLFKQPSLPWYSTEGFRTREGAAPNSEEGVGTADGRADCGSVERELCLNPQASSGVTVTTGQTNALVAQDHGNHPAVLHSAGFSTEHSAQSRSIGYEEEKSPTLRAGVVPAALALDHHPMDSRLKISEDGICQTLTERCGTGGGNVPLIAESMAFGVCSKKSHAMLSDNPHSGFYEATTSRTLDCGGSTPCRNQGGICIVAPATNGQETYDVRFTSDGTRNARGHCYKTEISRCLDTSESNPEGNHGGVCVVEKIPAYALQGSMIGRKPENGPQGDGINEEVCFTLDVTDRHAVAFTANQRDEVRDLKGKAGALAAHPGMKQQTFVAEEHATYSATVGGFMSCEKEKAQTLMARDFKDPQIVNDMPDGEPMYIVRRLTPTESARLQGFPDWWCENLAVPNPAPEELSFWMEVWETWNKMSGKKPKSEKMVRKWLSNPYSDSAVYKLYGNACSVPVVYYVLSGIAWAAQRECSCGENAIVYN